MLDPYTYILLHKYKRLERMKQMEEARLLQVISRPTIRLQSIRELSRLISNWWIHRHQTVEENRLGDGKVVMP